MLAVFVLVFWCRGESDLEPLEAVRGTAVFSPGGQSFFLFLFSSLLFFPLSLLNPPPARPHLSVAHGNFPSELVEDD